MQRKKRITENQMAIRILNREDNPIYNLFCSCHTCNLIKHDIYPQDFMEKISKIFMFQMRIKNKKFLKWRIIHKVLKEMI